MENVSIINSPTLTDVYQETQDIIKNYKLLSKKGPSGNDTRQKLLHIISCVDTIKKEYNISENHIAVQTYNNHLLETADLKSLDLNNDALKICIFFTQLKTYNDTLYTKQYRTPTLEEYEYHLLNKQNKIYHANAIQALQHYYIPISLEMQNETNPPLFSIPKNVGTDQLDFLIRCIHNMCQNKRGVLREMVKIIMQKISTENEITLV